MKSTKKTFHLRSPSSPKSRSRLHSSGRGSFAVLIWVFALFSSSQQPTFAQARAAQDYLVYVLSEAADKISLIRFGPNGARVDHELVTGGMPADIDGPHGIAISRDKKFYYVSQAHGRPFG